MDWSTAAILAALLWADGVRRVPAGSLVLRRVLAGPWRVVDVAAADGWRPVGWWPPLSMAIVLPPPGEPPGDDPAAPRASPPGSALPQALPARLALVRGELRLLRALGAAVVLTLVALLPTATRRSGTFGLLATLALLLLLCLTSTMVAVRAHRRLGAPTRAAWRRGAPLVWPFSAPTGADRVLAAAIGNVPPVDVATALLGPAELAMWARPLAYDALHGAARRSPGTPPSALVDALADRLGPARLRALVSDPPAGVPPGALYCPRCGAEYRETVLACADCRLVPLRRGPAAGIPAGERPAGARAARR